MAREYTIEKISEQEPREWANPHGGVIYYIKCMLNGHNKPVEVGKKRPDALKVGDSVYGDIEETDYLTDKFKSAQRPQTGNNTNTSGGYRRDDDAIRAQWAIGQAVSSATMNPANSDYYAEVEDIAQHFYHMVDRVKSSGIPKDNTREESF